MNKRFFLLTSAVALALGVLTMTASSRADILDQDNSAEVFGGTGSVATGFVETQTFTVGMDGVLSHIDVKIDQGGSAVEDITMTLLTTDVGGAPDSVLTSAVLTPADVGTNFSFVSFDVSSANIGVTTGDVLAIQLSSPAANDVPYQHRYDWRLDPLTREGPPTKTVRKLARTTSLRPTSSPSRRRRCC